MLDNIPTNLPNLDPNLAKSDAGGRGKLRWIIALDKIREFAPDFLNEAVARFRLPSAEINARRPLACAKPFIFWRQASRSRILKSSGPHCHIDVPFEMSAQGLCKEPSSAFVPIKAAQEKIAACTGPSSGASHSQSLFQFDDFLDGLRVCGDAALQQHFCDEVLHSTCESAVVRIDRVPAASQILSGSASPFPVAELLEDRELQCALHIAPLHTALRALALRVAARVCWFAIDPTQLLLQMKPVGVDAGNGRLEGRGHGLSEIQSESGLGETVEVF